MEALHKARGVIGLILLASALHGAAADFPLFEPSVTPRVRVVIVENPQATTAFAPNSWAVQEMVNSGLRQLTGETNLKTAWRKFVVPKDTVGLKVYSGPGPNSGTRPAVVEAVIQGLLNAGLAPAHIIIWDRRMADLQAAGFADLADKYHVGLEASTQAGYDPAVAYTNTIIGTLVAGDLDFDRFGATSGRNSYVTRIITQQTTKTISIAPLLNNNVVNVCGHLYSLSMGSIDNSQRFEQNPNRLAQAVPEVVGTPPIFDHDVLNITDALIGQYQGEQMSLLHYSTELNQLWLSKDPVALDVLAEQELERERQANHMPALGSNSALYQNAALLELGVAELNRVRLEVVRQ